MLVNTDKVALSVIAVLCKMRCDFRVYDRSDCQNQLDQAKSFDFTLLHAGFSIRRMSDSSISLNRLLLLQGRNRPKSTDFRVFPAF